MAQLSANLGFLWTELTLPDAVRAAAKAGFGAVECHWPYQTAVVDLRAALRETGLPMLGLNTLRGNPGEMGLAALPGRQAEARAAIDQAIAYADAIDAANIHVMAGTASGGDAAETFADNLRYACAATRRTILIEPLNHRDAPGYFLQTSAQAHAIISTLGLANLKLLFDCYHLQIIEGDLTRRLEALLPHIGHIQIAAVPSRAEPDSGEVDYRHILHVVDQIGYAGWVGAEYRPLRSTQEGLGWMVRLCP